VVEQIIAAVRDLDQVDDVGAIMRLMS
jgi:hypothetical protein